QVRAILVLGAATAGAWTCRVRRCGKAVARLWQVQEEYDGMAETTLVQRSERPSSTRASEVVLQTRALCKRYGQRLVVDNLNLEVHRGEIFGFLGPNGAGKTTTIRMALGLITPTSGHVEVLGKDVATHRAEILPRVGALVEQPALYLYMS